MMVNMECRNVVGPMIRSKCYDGLNIRVLDLMQSTEEPVVFAV